MATVEDALDVHQGLPILLFLHPKCTGALQAASKSSALAKSVSSQALWSAYAQTLLGLSGPSSCRGPQGEDCGDNWAKAFQLWQVYLTNDALDAMARAGLHGPMRARWIAVWHRLHKWLHRNLGSVEATLRKPVSQVSWDLLKEHNLECANPAVIGCWCLHDGQDARMDPNIGRNFDMPRLRDDDDEWSHGLFGGYTVYRHEVSTVLLPLHAALKLTRFLRERGILRGPALQTRVAFACSHNLAKILFVDVKDGSVWVWTGREECMFELAVPSSGLFTPDVKVKLHGLKARPDLNALEGCLVAFDKPKGRWQVRMEDGSGIHLIREENLQQLNAQEGDQPPIVADALLRWFEEYASRLEGGIYGVIALRPEALSPTHGICLFPATGPELSRCVTRGVEVTASCVYTPENANGGWAYSIAFRIVGSESERGFKTCQLHVRHWVIKEDGNDAQHVNGDGVVGFHPILTDGGWLLNEESDPNDQYCRPKGFVEGPFRYQSCTGRSRNMKGSFGGDLTFIPGTLKKPTGPPFQVELQEFRLFVPDYIF